jgi:hypothetical protein
MKKKIWLTAMKVAGKNNAVSMAMIFILALSRSVFFAIDSCFSRMDFCFSAIEFWHVAIDN